MATTIEQQVAMDEALVLSTRRLMIERSNLRLPWNIQSKESTLQLVYDVLRRCPFFKAFPVTADVPEIYMQEFWAIAYVHQQSIRFKINNKKLIVSLESFREMLHISPRIPGQSFDELPFEEEILEFIRFLGHSATIRILTDPWRSFAAIINKCLTGKSSGYDSFRLSQAQILNTMSYKEYYAFATGEAAPKPKASTRRKRSGSDTFITPPTTTTTPKLTAAAKGKQPAKAKSLSDPSEVARKEAQQLKIVLRRSRQQTHISQPGGFGTDEGTGSKPRVPDVPTNESEEELSWNSFDDEGADDQKKVGDEGNDSEEGDEDDDDDEDKNGDERDEGDESDEGEEDADEDKDGDESDDDEENQETAKYDEQDDAEGGGNDEKERESDEEDDNEETREEENFDPIPRTPKSSEDEGDGEEDQGLNINEEEHVEEEEEDELYRDVNINKGMGLQATLKFEDTHVTLTPINSDGEQESSCNTPKMGRSGILSPGRVTS
nr:hypothetical protein [Tanacetum cinerariifolium]